MNNHDHRKKKKKHKCKENGRACRYVRNARKGLRRLSGQTRKGYSEESRDDDADSTDKAVHLRRYYPKRTRARSGFEGVGTPRNEGKGVYERKLRSNKHQVQVHPHMKRKTKTSPAWREREDGVYVPIIHTMQGQNGPGKKKPASLQRFCELIL